MNIISSDGSIIVTQNGDCQVNLQTKPSPFNVSVGPTSSLLLSGNGGAAPITGNVRVSAQSGNTILLNPDGLYVPALSITETPLSTIGSPTITLGVSGIAAHTLTAVLNISAAAGNALVVNSDGVFVPASSNSGGYTDAQARNSISALPPLSYNNTTGVLSINKATGSQSGYLLSTDWTTFNSKEPAITPGNTSQYWRGDKTWQVLNTTVVPEGTNQYFTQVRARAAISATLPALYNAVTGIISIVQANGSQDGYLTSSNWTTFNSKIGGATSLASGLALSVYKDTTSSDILEFRGVRGDGTTVTSSLVGDDIVLSSPQPVPQVSAGSNQSITLPTSSSTMVGSASTPSGTIVSTTWFQMSGPDGAALADATSLNTAITGLSQGTFVFRLLGINSYGLSNTSDMAITVGSGTVVSDIVYIGASSSGSVPNSSTILAGTSSTQNGAFDVSADWTPFNGSPQFCWFAIPDLGPAYEKNKWFVDVINNGNIGGPSDLFGALSTVVVNGVNYSVGITNYQTQFVAVCLLKKV